MLLIDFEHQCAIKTQLYFLFNDINYLHEIDIMQQQIFTHFIEDEIFSQYDYLWVVMHVSAASDPSVGLEWIFMSHLASHVGHNNIDYT